MLISSPPKLLLDERSMEVLEYALTADLLALVALLICTNSGWRESPQNRQQEHG